jgi:hypothetical protein
MPRKPKVTTIRTTVTVRSDTLEAIDAIARSFEPDFVSRGELIDMAFNYIFEDDDRVDEVFGEDKESEDKEAAD